jgi:hypothetical protein
MNVFMLCLAVAAGVLFAVQGHWIAAMWPAISLVQTLTIMRLQQ